MTLQPLTPKLAWPVLLLAGVAVLTGCKRAHKVSIEHPARTGTIEPHDISVRDGTESGETYSPMGVRAKTGTSYPPGSLTDIVKLVRLDAGAICFDFKVNAKTRDEVELVSLAVAIVDPEEAEGLRPHLEPSKIMSRSAMGSARPTLVQGEAEYPGDDGYRLVEPDVRVGIFTGGGTTCFPNPSAVTPETSTIRVHTEIGDLEWTLKGATTGWKDDVIVMHGYERLGEWKP